MGRVGCFGKLRGKRGIALISALIISVFLVALTGAFMTVNQTHFAIIRNSKDQVRAQRAAQAGLEWAFYNMEHDRNWGVTEVSPLPARPGSNTTTAAEDFKIDSVDGQTAEARYLPLEAKLTIEVVNNINSAPLPQAQVNEALSMGQVPAEHARIKVTAYAGGSVHTAEALLRLAPLYGDTFFADGEIDVEASERFSMSSNDEFRNSVKATGDVHLPDVAGHKTKFLKPDGTADTKGIIQAQGSVYSDSNGIDEELTPEDILKTGGKVLSQVNKKFPFFDLEPTDLPVAGEASQVEAKVASGEYRFTRSKAVADFRHNSTTGSWTSTSQADIDVLEWYANPGDTKPAKVFRSLARLYAADSGSHILNTTTFQYSSGGNVNINDNSLVTADVTSYVVFKANGEPEALPPGQSPGPNDRVFVNLDSQKLTVRPGTQVTANDDPNIDTDGTLQITNKEGAFAATNGAAFKTPTLELGSNGEDVSIRAANDLELSNAITTGVGTLISEQGNISLKPIANGNFDVSSPSNGLALYAKKDVTVANPGGANWNFEGTVFAGDDFVFDANPSNDGNSYDVSFRGAVIAKNDDSSGDNNGIAIKNGRKVSLTYEPEYLKFLNRNLKGPDGVPRDISLEYLYRKI